MNIKHFNVCMLLGWLMMLAGGVLIHPGWGLGVAGAVLMAGSALTAYLGGVYAPEKPADPGQASA